ncbi:MAG: hypothetical protein ACQESC_02185 [Nanobdellota archaeon]
MKLNGKEFDTVDGKEKELFEFMDTLEKKVLSKDISSDGIPSYDPLKECLLIVHNHAIALPKIAKERFESEGWIRYLDDK